MMGKPNVFQLSIFIVLLLILLIPEAPRWLMPFVLAGFFLYAPIVIEMEEDKSLIKKYKPFCYVISGSFLLIGVIDVSLRMIM
ncbi:hypothetical protein [Alkalicoccus daliensis]|uniref:Uncharacterized protein n=1 Tax=Alkalicoccus daliensis TaxID=745820 RepID=A0A1H0GV06_9BACI|nr:hypothetical protein [Alkalicoccus daliensis]SDO10698.1 hypothetical protein SAMN04488053_10745 [Alkalicoccus daliensis]